MRHASAATGGWLSVGTVVTVSPSPVRVAVEHERRALEARIVELESSFDDIAASVDTANTDDEHDPEGTTLAFERAQVVSLLEEARAGLEALDDAAARIDEGTYGTCARCGRLIGAERLAVLPGAQQCVDCARTSSRSR
jgi:RNA polymerase-binding transcription factor DksA